MGADPVNRIKRAVAVATNFSVGSAGYIAVVATGETGAIGDTGVLDITFNRSGTEPGTNIATISSIV